VLICTFVHFIHPHVISLRSILTLSSNLRLGLQNLQRLTEMGHNLRVCSCAHLHICTLHTPHVISVRSILILSSNLRLGLQNLQRLTELGQNWRVCSCSHPHICTLCCLFFVCVWMCVEFDISLLSVRLEELRNLTSCYPRMFVRVGFSVHSQAARGLQSREGRLVLLQKCC